jgi:hypothetical protein
MLHTGMDSVCRSGKVEWGWLGMQFVLEMRSCRGRERELMVLYVFPDNYIWHTSCLCDCTHQCNISIITSIAALLRLLDHEDGEMSSHIYQSVWYNIPEDLNLYLSRSNINTKFLVNKTNRCTEFQLYWCYYSTCFRQPFRPSSGVLSRTSALVHFMQLCYSW